MRLDQFSNPIFNEQDIFEALYKGLPISSEMFVDATDDTKSLEAISNLNFWLPLDNYTIPVDEYDSAMQCDWFMPDEYKTLDIELYVASKCPEEHYERLADELDAFKARNMLNLLRYLKYFVDTCEKENILWGVGRGSSVASYVLFLIGVHNVDSIKYNLDWREFLR
jgi:DNA polymerase III alpha subunit